MWKGWANNAGLDGMARGVITKGADIPSVESPIAIRNLTKLERYFLSV
jgi:hypothetical protein